MPGAGWRLAFCLEAASQCDPGCVMRGSGQRQPGDWPKALPSFTCPLRPCAPPPSNHLLFPPSVSSLHLAPPPHADLLHGCL